MHPREISDHEIEEARRVLDHHSPKPVNHEGALECLLWCISSQALSWELTSRFVYKLRTASHGAKKTSRERYTGKNILHYPSRVERVAKAAGLRFTNRFREPINYFKHQPDGWWEDIINADSDTRERYVNNVKWVGRKTFSFWHICLGGKNLIALDVHVMRQLRNSCGINLDNGYIEGIKRNKKTKVGEIYEEGQQIIPFDKLELEIETKPKQREITQIVRLTPEGEDYLRIEEETRKKFGEDPRFMIGSSVDMALVDAVLWWRGARRRASGQEGLFGANYLISEFMPYAKTIHS